MMNNLIQSKQTQVLCLTFCVLTGVVLYLHGKRTNSNKTNILKSVQAKFKSTAAAPQDATEWLSEKFDIDAKFNPRNMPAIDATLEDCKTACVNFDSCSAFSRDSSKADTDVATCVFKSNSLDENRINLDQNISTFYPKSDLNKFNSDGYTIKQLENIIQFQNLFLFAAQIATNPQYTRESFTKRSKSFISEMGNSFDRPGVKDYWEVFFPSFQKSVEKSFGFVPQNSVVNSVQDTQV